MPRPPSRTEPLWVGFADLIGSAERPEFSPIHPWGCHRRKIPDRVVFDHVIAALVHGSGYERIVTPGCSNRTIPPPTVDGALLVQPPGQLEPPALAAGQRGQRLAEGQVPESDVDDRRAACARRAGRRTRPSWPRSDPARRRSTGRHTRST